MSIQITNIQTTDDLTVQQSAADTQGAELGKDAFLKLMLTQLQHQDPLDPMDNDQFISQLAQLTQVEEMQNTNAHLEEMLLSMASLNNATMVNLIGQEVKAVHDGFHYEGTGEEALRFELESPATSATVTIYDEDGQLVATKTLGSVETGMQTFSWDGTTVDGRQAEAGNYTFKVTAVDGDGEQIAVNQYLIGTVDELDFSTGIAVPIVDDQILSISQIVSLVTPEQASESDPDETP